MLQLPLAAQAAPSGEGMDQGSRAMNLSRKPHWVSCQAITALIRGTPIKGRKNNGFMMMGKPNSSGSLMLNMEGMNPSLPTDWMEWLRLRMAMNTRGKVVPIPPISR